MPNGTDEVLRAGLRWLFDTEQPDGALLQHHGEQLLAANDNRVYKFAPTIWARHAVIIVEVAEKQWTFPRSVMVPDNPIRPNELRDLSNTLAGLGAEVCSTWNGNPLATGSLALTRPAHPSLAAAVDLYHAGCPTHPKKSVFCECGWYAAGYARVVQLKHVASAAGVVR